MFLLYDLIFLGFSVLYIPYLIVRKKWHSKFGTRFGFLARDVCQQLAVKNNIWIHAVSVGEVMAVKKLVQQLERSYPGRQIVISTVTTTGQKLAVKQFPNACVLYAPLDFSWSVCAYIRKIQPELYIAAETEIWPNIFYFLNRQGVPIVQINGRISDTSYPRYKRFSFALKRILATVGCFCMQTQEDARRLIDIGADPERVFVTGNMKFDEDIQGGAYAHGKIFGADHDPVWVAGSTHPGEEEIILNVFQRLREEFSGLSLVLAPRHIERVSDIESFIRKVGLSYTKFSQLAEMQPCSTEILLVDTIGHLKDLYAHASIVFVGKSLLGKGGQNIIEPASFGKPVIIGPHTQNFRSIVEMFKKADAVMIVSDEKELFVSIKDFLSHPDRALEMGERAQAVVASQKGAVLKTFQHIQSVFLPRG